MGVSMAYDRLFVMHKNNQYFYLEHLFTSFELFYGVFPPMYVCMCALCGSELKRELLQTLAK